MLVLKFLKKNPSLQKDTLIWDRLEYLLNNSHQNVKKEILKLLSVNDSNTLKYLIDMYDDESPEIRHFVFDKISELEDFSLINPSDKLRLLYVGLSDNSPKVVDSAISFLKKFTEYLKIFKGENNNDDPHMNNNSNFSNEDNLNTTNNFGNLKKEKKNEFLMDIESADNSQNYENNHNKTLNRNNENTKEIEEAKAFNLKEFTVHEKIIKASSPLKLKKKLQDSPFRLFDHLDSKRFYNHPKLSFAFHLITAQLIDMINFDDLIEYVGSIVDNLIFYSNSETNFKMLTHEKLNKRNSKIFHSASSGKGGKVELFNDVFFLQSNFYDRYIKFLF